MPAPVVRSASARSCTRTRQPRCASAQAAVRPAKPAPAISAVRSVMPHGLQGAARSAIVIVQSAYAKETAMARLRHIAVVVRDIEASAKFYEEVFELRRVGREDLEIGSAVYMTDGVINMALL